MRLPTMIGNLIVGCICLSAENTRGDGFLASACRVAAAISIADAHAKAQN